MPSYKQMLDLTNAMTGVTVNSLLNMGLNIPLIWNEFANSFNSDGVKGLLDSTGLKIEGTDVKSIAESFTKRIKEVGFCQRANLLEVSDNEVVIDLGECVLAPITKVIRGTDLDKIPPCPFMALLYGSIEKNTGKKGFIESAKWKPEENTTIFKLKLEG
jgi:hypothetical protein